MYARLDLLPLSTKSLALKKVEVEAVGAGGADWEGEDREALDGE